MNLLKPTKATVGNDKGMIRINRQIRRLLTMLDHNARHEKDTRWDFMFDWGAVYSV
jgi:hypothetical protein